jgi:spore coat polysaccharide biosynthesis protein SpsF
LTSSEPERVVCVVQARTGSHRLAGKVLMELGGRPLLRFMLDRLGGVDADVVVATTTEPRDDPVAELAADAGAAVVRGPEDDVLARYVQALDAHPADVVVRLTADCPLVDPALVGAVLGRRRATGADYATNVLPRTFPKGLDVEVMTAGALRAAAAEATRPVEREHVTPFLYRHPERFRLTNVRSDHDLGHVRWTVDTMDDLDAVRSLVDRLDGDRGFGWQKALTVWGPAPPAPGAVHLRPATAADTDRLLAWRNDDGAVRTSRTGRTVAPDEHRAWLARRLDDPATRLWVAELDGEPMGSARVDVTGAQGTVSIVVDPARRGRGRGSAMLAAVQEQLAGDPQVDELVADVHVANETSRRLFAAAGFTPVPAAATDGADDGFARYRWESDPR